MTTAITVGSVKDTELGNTLIRAHLENPKAGTSGITTLVVSGWVVSPRVRVESTRVFMGTTLLAEGPLDRPRPDLAFGGPTPLAGFQVRINALNLPREFTCRVIAQAANGIDFELGTFDGSRGCLDLPRSGTLQPLLVTCLGRTGSTWLVRLLSCHPEIVCYRPFAHEARVASYWAAVFASLSSAASVSQLLDPTDLHSKNWWIGRELDAAVLPDESAKWAVEDHLQSLADFCRDRVESFYRQLAGAVAGTRFFGEKYAPGASIDPLCELYPGLRELVLVRDFRDMAASVFAFNNKRGYLAFGRECVRTDEEYVRRLAQRDTADLLSHWEQRRNEALLVRYEDLVVKLGVTLQSVFEAIGVANDETTISRVIASASEKIPAMEFHQTSTDMASSIGRWRDLPASLRRLVNRELGEVLSKFGYEDGDMVPSRIRHESTAKDRPIPRLADVHLVTGSGDQLTHAGPE